MDELTICLDRLQEIYLEVFDKQTDKRIVSDHAKKILQLLKLRAFVIQSGDFLKITEFLNQIMKRESELGAKLLEADMTQRVKDGKKQAERLQIETQVLLEYHEEVRVDPNAELDEVSKGRREKVDRKRLEMLPMEKLNVAYLVAMRDVLVQSNKLFQKLKILSSENQLRITAQFTLNNYISYCLQKHITVFSEQRHTLLETINFLRKKFKVWPQTLKYHSL
jgi:hypothetical protein